MRIKGRFKIAAVVAAVASLAAIGMRAPLRGQTAGAAVGNWALHNLDLQNSRYAPFDDIHAGNVGTLVEKWRYDAPAADNVGRATPLAVDGVLYFNGGSKLFALDAATGKELWVTRVEPPFPASGRGPAYADGRIYAFGPTVLYAVDAKTGRVVESFGNKGRLNLPEQALAAKYRHTDAVGYSIQAPPAYYNGTLYVGLALSEAHIPGGLMVALDGRTGAVKWVFNTVPQGPADDGWEIAKDTWRGGQRVGGGIWTQPAIDPELGLVYVNVGNPSPDYDGSARKGENLFTNAVVALHLETGKLAWYYQTIHHEVWDFDLVTGPILFDVRKSGRTIKGIASGGKNCLLYAWHRDTGKPINPMVEMAVPTATDVPGEEIWPTQPFPHTAKGVPMQPFCQTFPIIDDPELAKRARQIYHPYSVKEKYILSHGGGSFGSPSFSPLTGLLYITGKDAAISFTVQPVGDGLKRGQGANIGHDRVIAEGPFRGEQVGVPNREKVSAFDPVSGELVWQADFPTPTAISSSGNLVTAGNVVFQGSESGLFYAFDAKLGAQLLAFKAPRAIRASPMTHKVNGRQYVTVVAGNSVVSLGLP
jgi:PQQ-dependent dehydrogenase (methanol/ethanol family)